MNNGGVSDIAAAEKQIDPDSYEPVHMEVHADRNLEALKQERRNRLMMAGNAQVVNGNARY